MERSVAKHTPTATAAAAAGSKASAHYCNVCITAIRSTDNHVSSRGAAAIDNRLTTGDRLTGPTAADRRTTIADPTSDDRNTIVSFLRSITLPGGE